MMLHCRKCGKDKTTDGFYRNNQAKRGFGYWCKDCHRVSLNDWYHENKGRFNERRSKYRGGYAGNIAVIRGTNTAKENARRALASGAAIVDVLPSMLKGDVQARLCDVIINGGGFASLDDILSHVYGGDPVDRPRLYNALRKLIFNVRNRIAGSGISLINCGYGKGYSLVIDAELTGEAA